MLILATAVLLSACVKTPVEPQNIHFSILGDSYSAFEGYIDPATNDPYEWEIIGVTDVEQMWWHQVAVEMGWTMDKNNSFSASLVCNNSDFTNGDYYTRHSFLRRLDYLGNPDVIFVFGATNDACANDGVAPRVPLGDYVYDNWTEEQLCSFRPGFAYMFERLKSLYPNAKLYFLLDMDLGSGGIDNDRRAAFIESIRQITNHYNVRCIDLYYIHKTQWHPNVKGQQDIARQVLEAIGVDFNV